MDVLTVNNLEKSYEGKRILNDISFRVQTGQLVSLLGPNGAGKSTTLKILTSLINKDNGDIEINGFDFKDKPALRNKNIGVVFQDSRLDNELTVEANLITRKYFYDPRNYKDIDDVLQYFNAKSLKKQKYGNLSGGQKRRIDIARAFLGQPNLLFLDEPTTGLDAQTRVGLWQTLNEMRRVHGCAILLTTHYLQEAEASDFIYVLDHGEIVASGTPAALEKRYVKSQLIITAGDFSSIERLIPTQFKVWYMQQQLHILLDTEMSAIAILEKAKTYIKGFEIRRGSIEDVYFNITGKKISANENAS